MQSPDCSRGGGDEGEEEAGGEPIDDAGICGVKVCGGVGDGGEGEPLGGTYQPLSVPAGLWAPEMNGTYVPAHDDVKQNQLGEAEPPDLVHPVFRVPSIDRRNFLFTSSTWSRARSFSVAVLIRISLLHLLHLRWLFILPCLPRTHIPHLHRVAGKEVLGFAMGPVSSGLVSMHCLETLSGLDRGRSSGFHGRSQVAAEDIR